MVENEESWSEKIIFYVLFLVFGIFALYVTEIAIQTLIPTNQLVIFSTVAGLLICVALYHRDWEFLFDDLTLSVITLVFATIFVMTCFTFLNYITAKPTLLVEDYKIINARVTKKGRRSRIRSLVNIRHRNHEMSLHITPLQSESEMKKYSHIKIRKWQGLFGFGAEIVENTQLINLESR